MNDIIWSPGIKLEELEKQAILKAFLHYRGNKTTTANALGISIRTLDNKLDKYQTDQTLERERQSDDAIKRKEWLARFRGEIPMTHAVQVETKTTADVKKRKMT